MSKRLSEEEIRHIQLSILVEIGSICRKNNLRYYLCGGTLLGAVRHKGFIPWDDDIDIDMPRKDLLILERLLENHPVLGVLGDNSEENYNCMYKIVDKRTYLRESTLADIPGMGIFIDVFPQDGLPDNHSAALKHFRRARKLQDYLYYFGQDGFDKTGNKIYDFIRELRWKSIKKKGLDYWRRLHHDIVTAYNFDDSKEVFSSGGRQREKEIKPKKFLENTLDIDFEGYKLLAPADYDTVLRHFYGNYMELPPEDKRIPEHSLVVYWK